MLLAEKLKNMLKLVECSKITVFKSERVKLFNTVSVNLKLYKKNLLYKST